MIPADYRPFHCHPFPVEALLTLSAGSVFELLLGTQRADQPKPAQEQQASADLVLYFVR